MHLNPSSTMKLEVIQPRRIGTKLLAAACILLVLLIVRAFWVGQIWWSVVGDYLFARPVLIGLVSTIVMTFAAMALGIVLGVGAAVMRMSNNAVRRTDTRFSAIFGSDLFVDAADHHRLQFGQQFCRDHRVQA